MELNEPIAAGWLDLDMLSRLGAAAVIGLLLGLERELRGHAAGLRTHGIICFASAAMAVSAIALYNQLDNQQIDPLRLFEATGAFVGIIGAGLVVFSKGEIHNVTTAAHLWLTAVIGLACGTAQWPLVAIASAVGLLLLIGLGAAERHLFPRTEANKR